MHQGKPAGEGGKFAEGLVMETSETATVTIKYKLLSYWPLDSLVL